jgi:hypothetical protein
MTPEQLGRAKAVSSGRSLPRPGRSPDASQGEPTDDESARSLLVSLVTSLRAEREKRGISLTDIADASGLDRAMVSRLENGKIDNPRISTLMRYAGAIGGQFEILVRWLSPEPQAHEAS